MTTHWTLLRKILFRFLAIYLLLYLISIALDFIPPIEGIAQFVHELWDTVAIWIGKHVLHLESEVFVGPTGSGDTTRDYIQVFVILLLSLILTATVSVVDRQRRDYRVAMAWLTLSVRYMLAFILLSYGFYKVFKAQFPFPSPYRLSQTFGDASPMGLAWAFMGYSTGYNLFTGLGEVVGGLLLFFRKTTNLGAIVVVTVMSNIVALNFFYDIPVKLFSSHLLLMALFLLANDATRLINFLFLNRPVPAQSHVALFTSRPAKVGRAVTKVVLIGLALFTYGQQGMSAEQQHGDRASRPPLYGIHHVDLFIRNNDTLPPLATDTTRWKSFIIGYPGYARVKLMNDSLRNFLLEVDTLQQTLTMTPREDTLQKYHLHYSHPADNHLLLTGIVIEDSITIEMQEVDLNQFLLVRRRFHWINEYPYNR